MNPQTEVGGIIRFGPFTLDAAAGELRKHDLKIKLQGQPIEILAMLLERPGQVVTREEIQKRLWPANTVEFEHSVNAAIKRLRDALDDDADAPHYVETLPKRGYRFIAAAELARSSRVKRRTWYLLGSATAAVLFLGMLFALNIGSLREKAFRGHGTPIRSIAILPLANLSSDPQQDYFVEGMTEALITELGKISALRVISRQSMMQYKGTKKSAPQIARELNVEAIVEGSIIQTGDRVRISVKLIAATPERHLWSSSYDRQLRDVLALHSELASAIANEVQAKLTADEHHLLTTARPIDPQAWAAYLRGRYFWNQTTTAQGLKHALDSFQAAVQKDPSFAAAHASSAYCYLTMSYFEDPTQLFPKAEQAALSSLKNDDTVAEGHSALGYVKMAYYFDWSGAEREFRRAIQLNPNSIDSLLSYAMYLTNIGRSDDAINTVRRGQQLDPLSVRTNRHLAWHYMFARRLDEAIEQYNRTLELDPNNGTVRERLAWCYLLKGMHSAATAELNKSPQHLNDPRTYAYIYAVGGRHREALRQAQKLRDLSQREYVDPYDIARAYVNVDAHQSLVWLNRAYDKHSFQCARLRAEPFFDPLRSDPRFQDLLRRMKFPPDIPASASLN